MSKPLSASLAIAVVVVATEATATIMGVHVEQRGRPVEQICADLKRAFENYTTKMRGAPVQCVVLNRGDGVRRPSGMEALIQLRPDVPGFLEMDYDFPPYPEVINLEDNSDAARAAFREKMLQGQQFFKDLEAAGASNQPSPAYTQAKAMADQAAVAQHNAKVPKCRDVIVSGYAAFNPYNLTELEHSTHPHELLAQNPLTCEQLTHRREVPYGGIMTDYIGFGCHGATVLSGKRAKVVEWSDNGIFYHVQTTYDFNVGRRAVQLYVRPRDARCAK